MDIDLNLDNYNYNELLTLFHIDKLTESNLKKAKIIVLKTHPDKSKLDKKLFLFFSSAYKKLLHIYEFVKNYKSKLDEERHEFDYEILKDDEEGLHKLLRNDKDFLKTFNNMFENTYIKENNGYDEWLKSNEDVHKTDISTSEMEQMRNNVRNELSVKKEVDGLGTNEYYDFDESTVYSSDVFSKFQYEDLKKAHHESLIPVTNEDYNNVKKYKNVNQLEESRSQEISTPPSLEQSKKYLNKINEQYDQSSIQTAFKLLDNDQKIKTRENDWWKKYKQIKNL